MLTVGLAKELYFIAHHFQSPLDVELKLHSLPHVLKLKIDVEGQLDVYYGEHHIWHEKIEGDLSFFGVESCDTISRIIACINNGTSWYHYRWRENP